MMISLAMLWLSLCCFYSHLRLCLYLPLTETLFSFFYPSLLIIWFSPEAKVVRPTQDTLRAARATGTSLLDSRNLGWWWNQTFPTSMIFINSVRHNHLVKDVADLSYYFDCSVCDPLLWGLNPAFHDLPLFSRPCCRLLNERGIASIRPLPFSFKCFFFHCFSLPCCFFNGIMKYCLHTFCFFWLCSTLLAH